MAVEKSTAILVVGGGISGITAAVEAAEVGREVFLVEKRPYLGGRVTQLNRYFPKLCPPNCGLEINFQRIKRNPNLTLYTMAEVTSISGEAGNYNVTVEIAPRYVNEKCTGCGLCVEAAKTEIPDEYNFGMKKVKAAYLPQEFAMPMCYVIDPSVIGTEEANEIKASCPYDAVDLEMQPKTETLNVGAIIWATGWKPYDANNLENLAFGAAKNVVTNMMFERLASASGPTGGKLLRPSDGKEISNIAFVQCAGSRDENNLAFCSYICCLASLKHTTYIREQYPDAEVTIFYIDIRALGKYESFFQKIEKDPKVKFVKGKVAKIVEDPETGDVILEAEDIFQGGKTQEKFEMAVLATGMEPSASDGAPSGISADDSGFVAGGDNGAGIFSAGCAKKPLDVASSVQDATAAAMKAIQATVRR